MHSNHKDFHYWNIQVSFLGGLLSGLLYDTLTIDNIQDVPGENVNILGGHSIGHSKETVYMYLCPIPNGFRDRAVSLYSSKIVDKKQILRTVSNNKTKTTNSAA
jgi:hypothetical protein